MKRNSIIKTWITLSTVILLLIIASSQNSFKTSAKLSSDITNNEIEIIFSNSTSGLSPYHLDNFGDVILDRAVKWDANGDGIFSNDEYMITTISPIVHYVSGGNESSNHFSPLLSELSTNEVEKPYIISSEWLQYNAGFKSNVTATPHPVNLQTSIYHRDPLNISKYNYFVLNIDINAETNLDFVNVSLYFAIDIGDYYNDWAIINNSNNEVMVTAKDNITNRWVGIYSNNSLIGGQVGKWDDGLGSNLDVWEDSLQGNDSLLKEGSGDIDVHLLFNLSSIPQNENRNFFVVVSFGNLESDLVKSIGNIILKNETSTKSISSATTPTSASSSSQASSDSTTPTSASSSSQASSDSTTSTSASSSSKTSSVSKSSTSQQSTSSPGFTFELMIFSILIIVTKYKRKK